MTAVIGFLILFVAFAVASPSFRSGNNIQNLLRQIAPTLIIGIGQGYVLITGNIDLSIGSVVGMRPLQRELVLGGNAASFLGLEEA